MSLTSGPVNVKVEVELEASRAPRISWMELTCLSCGEVAGYVEDLRVVRPSAPGRIRRDGRRFSCGRCGGMLIPGDRGVSNTAAGIG